VTDIFDRLWLTTLGQDGPENEVPSLDEITRQRFSDGLRRRIRPIGYVQWLGALTN